MQLDDSGTNSEHVAANGSRNSLDNRCDSRLQTTVNSAAKRTAAQSKVSSRLRRSTIAILVFGYCFATSSPLAPSSAGPQAIVIAGQLPSAFLQPYPTSLDDLKEIENHVARLVVDVKPATVAVRVANENGRGAAFGSGVIVSQDGYILTAGHVSGESNREADVILSDGREVKAVTLGRNIDADSGLMKIISDRSDWSYAEMAPRETIELGHWCAALGHPGGVKPNRDAVLRLGRILDIIDTGDQLVQTDCELVGGDSGGPLFDMRGRVIGINSRIAEQADMNFHVPVGLYVDEWDRLASGEEFRNHSGAYLGVKGKRGSDGFGLQITTVETETAAEKIGIKLGDVIVKFDGERVDSITDLVDLVGMAKPGDRVQIKLLRDGSPVTLYPRLGER